MEFLFIIVVIIATIITWLMIKLSHRLGIVDHPGQRRSHDVITPRGGGWAIVLPVMVCGLYFINEDGHWPLMAWLSVLSIVAVGWLDDLYQLSAKIRLFVQLLASFVFIVTLMPDQSVWVQLIATIMTIWFINLYNFMDGIDLLLVSQLGFVLVCMLLIWPQNPLNTEIVVMLAAAFGFAFFNVTPARVFMGDVGSTFIGMIVAGLAVSISSHGSSLVNIYPAILLSAVFLVDAGLTLLHRVIQRKSIFQAHNEHCYQYLVRIGWSHIGVVIVYLLVNIVLVGGVVWLVYVEGITPVLYVVSAALLMVGWWFTRQYAIQRLERNAA